jgi:hypothetical protein
VFPSVQQGIIIEILREINVDVPVGIIVHVEGLKENCIINFSFEQYIDGEFGVCNSKQKECKHREGNKCKAFRSQ